MVGRFFFFALYLWWCHRLFVPLQQKRDLWLVANEWLTDYYHLHLHLEGVNLEDVVNSLQITIINTTTCVVRCALRVVNDSQIICIYTKKAATCKLWMAYRLHEQQRPAQSRKGRQLWMAYGLYVSTPLTVSMNGMTRLWIARRLLSLTPILCIDLDPQGLWIAYRLLSLTTLRDNS